MGRGSILLAIGLSAQIATAHAAGLAGLGFDPAKFGLPVYPNATLIAGTAISVPSAYGKTRRRAVLKTGEPEGKVAAWYAAHWKGARHQAFPHMRMDQFATGWGATNVAVSISSVEGGAEIRVMVPGD